MLSLSPSLLLLFTIAGSSVPIGVAEHLLPQASVVSRLYGHQERRSGEVNPRRDQDFRRPGRDYPTAWWTDERVVRELRLTAMQIAKLVAVHDKAVPTLKELLLAVKEAEQKLAALLKDPQSEEWYAIRVIDLVEHSRYQLSRDRLIMSYRQRQ